MGTDNRPKTVEYLTAEIFQPSCGAAQCHSTFAGNDTDVFDTVIGVRSSLVDNNLVRPHEETPNQEVDLIIWITQTDPFGRGIGRMPYDAPLPVADVKLLEDWIDAGAPGAQCNPNHFGGLTCNGDIVSHCDENWNLSTPVMDCSKAQTCGPSKNLQCACLNGSCQ